MLIGLAVSAEAQDISSSDRTAIRDIIQSQVEAFRRDDGDAAFGYASPTIRGMFGSSEIFMDMVRQGYQTFVATSGERPTAISPVTCRRSRSMTLTLLSPRRTT